MAENVMGWNGPISGLLTAGQTGIELARFSLDQFKAIGIFSLQAVVTGDGAITITYEVTGAPSGTSEADIKWEPGPTAIITAKAVGAKMVQYPQAGDLIFGKQIRLIGEETTTTDTVNYILWPNVQ